MLIKAPDDRSQELALLEAAASGEGDIAKHARAELSIRRAGVAGERKSAYYIDFHYKSSPNWAVIHDLRIEHDGRVAQIDHLLINRWLECYVLESKHFHAGLKISEEGEFLRWNNHRHTFEGMSSPLQQNERHIAVLRQLMSTLSLPTRFGFRLAFTFQALVLVSPEARIDRPKVFDTSRVIKADQIKEKIGRDIDGEGALTTLMSVAKIVSSETLKDVASQLATCHRPQKWPLLTIAAAVPVADSTPKSVVVPAVSANLVPRKATPVKPAAGNATASQGPLCKSCHSAEGSVQHGKYGYYFRCSRCATNTAIKFECQPGHNPRLRKAALQFFRECKECGTSSLYFTNAAE